MKRFLKMVAAIYVLNAVLLVAGMVWAWRYLRETDDAVHDEDDGDWDDWMPPRSGDIPTPTLPPRATPPNPALGGRVFDMRGTEYKFNQQTQTFQPVNGD